MTSLEELANLKHMIINNGGQCRCEMTDERIIAELAAEGRRYYAKMIKYSKTKPKVCMYYNMKWLAINTKIRDWHY